MSYGMRKVLQQLHSEFTSYTLVTEWMYVLRVMSPGVMYVVVEAQHVVSKQPVMCGHYCVTLRTLMDCHSLCNSILRTFLGGYPLQFTHCLHLFKARW